MKSQLIAVRGRRWTILQFATSEFRYQPLLTKSVYLSPLQQNATKRDISRPKLNRARLRQSDGLRYNYLKALGTVDLAGANMMDIDLWLVLERIAIIFTLVASSITIFFFARLLAQRWNVHTVAERVAGVANQGIANSNTEFRSSIASCTAIVLASLVALPFSFAVDFISQWNAGATSLEVAMIFGGAVTVFVGSMVGTFSGVIWHRTIPAAPKTALLLAALFSAAFSGMLLTPTTDLYVTTLTSGTLLACGVIAFVAGRKMAY